MKTAAGQGDARETSCLGDTHSSHCKTHMKSRGNQFRTNPSAKIIQHGADHGTPIDHPLRIGTVTGHQIHRISFYPYSTFPRFLLRSKLDRHCHLTLK